MSLFIERTAETKYGQIALAITQATHISVQIRQVEIGSSKYNVHAHYFNEGGVWKFRGQTDLSISRVWTGQPIDKREVAPSHRAGIQAELIHVLDQFIAENTELFVQAQAKYLAREIESATSIVNDLEVKLGEARGFLAKLIEQQGA